jgi:hypothetical protein
VKLTTWCRVHKFKRGNPTLTPVVDFYVAFGDTEYGRTYDIVKGDFLVIMLDFALKVQKFKQSDTGF